MSCKLGSELVFLYSGLFLDTVPTVRSCFVGHILTRNGELVQRDSRLAQFELVDAPLVYLFYDNDSHATYLVDGCRCQIKEVQPCGRALDCTDHVIYEAKKGVWCPICDLSQKSNKVIVLLNNIAADALSATFEYPGASPRVSEYSEIPANRVQFNNGVATVSFTGLNLPVGSGSVLLFTTCSDEGLTTIAKIFIRLPSTAITLAQCGTFAPEFVITPVVEGVTCPEEDFTYTVSADNNTYPITNWSTQVQYPTPNGFDAVTGTYTAQVAGLYNVHAILTYNAPSNIENAGRNEIPRYVLTRNNTIVSHAPVDINIGGGAAGNYNLNEQGQAVINTVLNLAAGDTLRIYYIDGLVPEPTIGLYRLSGLGTTFNIQRLA